VHHQIQPPLGRRGNPRLVSRFLKAVHRVQRFVALAAVAGDDQDALAHGLVPFSWCDRKTVDADRVKHKRPREARVVLRATIPA
jgi:hypothetical protein